MKSKKRIRMPRAIVVAGLLAALAVPAAASAKPVGWDNWSPASSSKHYVLPSTFRSETSTPVSTTSSSTPTVVREIHTVSGDSDHTLAIVLASAALGIALCGTGYAVVRLSLLQRRAPQSS